MLFIEEKPSLKPKSQSIVNWLILFDISKDKFEWFFEEEGFGLEWDDLLEKRKQEDFYGMLNIMKNVWYFLPDNKFNIKVMPPGWKDFIDLLDIY